MTVINLPFGIDLMFSSYVTRLILSGITIVVSVVVAKLLSVMTKRKLHGHYSKNITTIIGRFVYYLIIIAGVLIAAGNLGINLTSAIVAGGFLGIVIGLAAQSSVSNLIAGILLIIDRPFKVGDFITYGDITAGVIETGFLSTKVATWEGVQVRIPNNTLFNSNVLNYTKSIARLVRTQITLLYEEDISKVQKAVVDAFSKQWYVLVEPAPQAFPVQFTDTGIIMEIRVWTAGSTWGDLYFAMPELITDTMKNLKVKFAYPKRVFVNQPYGKR